MSNNCEPILNIKFPDLTLNQIQNLIELSQNRPLTISDIVSVSSQTTTTQPEQSRAANLEIPRDVQSGQQNISRPSVGDPTATGSGSGTPSSSGGSPSFKKCKPIEKERGGWSMPFTSHGTILGNPIEPREINCDCLGN